MTYTVKTSPMLTTPGCWNRTLCEVLRDGEKVGEYVYGYHSGADTIFAPFQVGDQWYALYSGGDYQSIAVMTLPDCKDVELTPESRANLHGHCPVEAWVPRYKETHQPWEHNGQKSTLYVYYSEDDLKEATNVAETTDDPWRYHAFAFVAGCVWGDDNSWKVNLLDMSGIARGEVRYTSEKPGKWTYREMPNWLKLRDCIRIERWDEGGPLSLQWVQPHRLTYIEGGALEVKS